MKIEVVSLSLVLAAAIAESAPVALIWNGYDYNVPRSAWRFSSDCVTFTNGMLLVDVPPEKAAGTHVACAELDFSVFGGRTFVVEAPARGQGLSVADAESNGLKFMFHYRDPETGTESWPNVPHRIGDFGITSLSLAGKFDAGELVLGLQGCSGRVAFDLSRLRVYEQDRMLFVRTNESLRATYSERVRKTPPLGGVMLGDWNGRFGQLRDWGARIARYQMNTGGTQIGDNRDIAAYRKWVQSQLVQVEEALCQAATNGIGMVLDLHSPPGGRSTGGAEVCMFHEPEYAEEFVHTWRTLAMRLRGSPGLWAYDLVNEPVQYSAGADGCDWWNLQRRAAEAIREIDPETPIVVSTIEWDGPDAYRRFSPFAINNIIYQVHMYNPGSFTHQRVYDAEEAALKWPDPSRGWDRKFLKEQLRHVRDFQLRHGARIYVGEFSAVCWAEGADRYLEDLIAVMDEYGWDWTYHAFREWGGWSVEHEGTCATDLKFVGETRRKTVLVRGLKKKEMK